MCDELNDGGGGSSYCNATVCMSALYSLAPRRTAGYVSISYEESATPVVAPVAVPPHITEQLFFNFTGTQQTFTPPPGVTQVTAVVVGGSTTSTTAG